MPEGDVPCSLGLRSIASLASQAEGFGMVGTFRLECSAAVVALVPKEVRSQIIHDAVASAERVAASPGETAIYDVHAYGLKVVVQFAERCIWLLTKNEADCAGLPDRPPLHTPN